jgi:hypothetical protein
MMKRLLVMLLIVGGCFLICPAPVRAANLFSGDCSGSASSSAVCSDTAADNKVGDPNPLITKFNDITTILAVIGGIGAVIMILVGAIRYITSGSDISTNTRTDNDVEDAKKTISGAVVGLVVIVLAKVIITYVVNRL